MSPDLGAAGYDLGIRSGRGTASSSGTQAQVFMGKSGGMTADKKFVKEAMEGGMAEVKLGQMASGKASKTSRQDEHQR